MNAVNKFRFRKMHTSLLPIDGSVNVAIRRFDTIALPSRFLSSDIWLNPVGNANGSTGSYERHASR